MVRHWERSKWRERRRDRKRRDGLEGGRGRGMEWRKMSRRHWVFLESPQQEPQASPAHALSSHQHRHRGGEGGGGVGCRAGQAGLTSCLMTSLLPPLAATVGPHQPATLSTGNNGELSGAVSPAASLKGGGSNASLPWASGPPGSSVQAMGRAQQLVGGPSVWVHLFLFLHLPGHSPKGFPYIWLLFAHHGGRQA